MNRFEFSTATRIIFGWDSLAEIGPLAGAYGKHALVVTGSDPAKAKRLLDLLNSEQVLASVFSIPCEPTLELVEQGTAYGKKLGADLVIGFGGGSAIDGAKAIAAMLTNPGSLLDYVEIIGRAQPIPNAPAPFIAIPTTAGTGAEVARNAVITSQADQVKVSLRSPLMLAKIALVDPALTVGLPPAITASTGLDALTQVIEPLVSSRANPMTSALCVDGIRLASRALPVVFADGSNRVAREEMALASLYGGLALANAGLGAVHGFAAPIGGMLPAPHGVVCAALLPHVMRVNIEALRQRAPYDPALEAYKEVAGILTGRPSATVEEGARWIATLVEQLRIPGLSNFGLTPELIDPLVEKAEGASSMKGNPIVLTREELREILRRAL
jgi:alcohol dehydrogenase class IV